MKKLMFLGFLIVGVGCTFGKNTLAADNAITTISGEITSGELYMTVPNNVSFSLQLNGNDQIKELDTINFDVTDNRGINEGWEITLKSVNFDTYNTNYTFDIGSQAISDTSVLVVGQNERMMNRSIALDTQVNVSGNATAGTYVANLEWTLQPKTIEGIRE